METKNLSTYSIFLTLLSWQAVLENTGKHGLLNDYIDAQSLAGHATAAMTEHYIKQREFKRVKPLR
jgi:hypothetical protein